MADALVVFHHLAAKEYRTALRYYARLGKALAQRFRAAVDRAIQKMASSPQQAAIFVDPYRWLRAGKFPYFLYYQIVDPTEVRILALGHGSRRPGYWLRRTRR